MRDIFEASTFKSETYFDTWILLEFLQNDHGKLVLARRQQVGRSTVLPAHSMGTDLSQQEHTSKFTTDFIRERKVCQRLAVKIAPGDALSVQVGFPLHSFEYAELGEYGYDYWHTADSQRSTRWPLLVHTLDHSSGCGQDTFMSFKHEGVHPSLSQTKSSQEPDGTTSHNANGRACLRHGDSGE